MRPLNHGGENRREDTSTPLTQNKIATCVYLDPLLNDVLLHVVMSTSPNIRACGTTIHVYRFTCTCIRIRTGTRIKRDS